MKYTTETLQAYAEALWESYCEIFPALVKFDCPEIRINNRFKRTGACCHTSDNMIEVGGKFFIKHAKNMLNVIIPHEMAHQIDMNLNGWYDRKKHHGAKWCDIMVKIGQEPNPYHSMEL